MKPPVLVYQADPRFPKTLWSKNTRVEVELVVGIDGLPRAVRVTRSGGKAYDKSALTAVSQYRFKPAEKDGQPVAVKLYVDVNFRD